MKRPTLLAIATLAALASGTASAETFTVDARVISSRPIVERIPVSREECWNEHQRAYENRAVTRTDTGAAIGPGTVLGAVVGGVIGHQFGNSSGGRDRGTAAGAIVGGLVGNQVDRQNAAPPEQVTEVERVPVDREVKRCRTVEEVREATVGFDVRYEYMGRKLATRVDRDPGRFLTLRVDLTPVEGRHEGPGPRPPVYNR
jgi:uncharacterized protein YcfJ